MISPREFVEKHGIKSVVCCFSGGKDSLVATHLIHEELRGLPLDIYVAFVDTSVMVPVAIDFAKMVSEKYDWDLRILHPKPDFWTLAEKRGAPRMRHRWCCYDLKLKPIIEFVKGLKPRRAEITGLRRDESIRRSKLPQIIYKKKAGSWGYAPIIDWTNKDVLRYIREHDLPMPPQYRLGIPETCLCGVFASKKRMMVVKALYPDLFKKFVELESKFRKGGAVFYFQNQPVYARDLLKQKTLDQK